MYKITTKTYLYKYNYNKNLLTGSNYHINDFGFVPPYGPNLFPRRFAGYL